MRFGVLSLVRDLDIVADVKEQEIQDEGSKIPVIIKVMTSMTNRKEIQVELYC